DLAPTLNEQVDAVILRGLSKEPADRYPDVIAFSAALREALEPAAGGHADGAGHDDATSPELAAVAGPLARPPRAVRTTVRLLRPRRWRRLLVPAAVVALAVLLATVAHIACPRTSGAALDAAVRWARASFELAAPHAAR